PRNRHTDIQVRLLIETGAALIVLNVFVRKITGLHHARDRHQSLRLAYRQHAQQQRIHHREDRDVSADPQRQRNHYHRRQQAILLQHPERIPKIVNSALPPECRYRVRALFHAVTAAEPKSRFSARLLGLHPVRFQLFRQRFQVEGHLFFHLAVQRRALEQQSQLRHPAHAIPPTSFAELCQSPQSSLQIATPALPALFFPPESASSTWPVDSSLTASIPPSQIPATTIAAAPDKVIPLPPTAPSPKPA